LRIPLLSAPDARHNYSASRHQSSATVISAIASYRRHYRYSPRHRRQRPEASVASTPVTGARLSSARFARDSASDIYRLLRMTPKDEIMMPGYCHFTVCLRWRSSAFQRRHAHVTVVASPATTLLSALSR
jgi:hypothetical protein